MTSRPHKIPSQPLTLLAVLLFALRAAAIDITKSPDDYFHNGAMAYLSNNIPVALNVVTNGLGQYPDDEKLKKLEALLKQQQQQQNQNQDQKQDQQKQQDQKKDQSQQSKQDDKQKSDEQKQKEEQDKQKQAQQPKPDEKKDSGEQQQAKASDQKPEKMTPEQAMRVLDTTKGEEKVLPVQMEKPPQTDKKLKDW